MAYGIKLKRYEIRNTSHWHLRVFRLRIEVEDVSGGMVPDVFIYRRHPADANGVVYDEFETVASVPDLAEYPTREPDANSGNSFFRDRFIEVDVRSLEHYNDVWETIVAEVTALVDALNKAEAGLVLAEELWVGDSGEGTSEAVSESPNEVSEASSP